MIEKKCKNNSLYNYMEWLEQFVKINGNFSSDYYLHNEEFVSDNDIDNIRKAEDVFRLVERYAEDNSVEASEISSEFFEIKNYYIKYKDKIYMLGFICENITVFHSGYAPKKFVGSTIDFADIEEYWENNIIKELQSDYRKVRIKND